MQQRWCLVPLLLVCLVWLAAPGLAMVESGLVSVGNNATITFPKAFASTPTVVCSAQSGSAAIMAALTSISKTNFKVLLRDTYNNTPSSAWVQWVAAVTEPGVQCGITTVSNGGHLSFPTAFASTPTVVTSGLQAGNPVMVTAISNSTSGCGIYFATHSGSTSNTVGVYWIATVPRSTWRCGVTKYSDGAALSFPALPGTPTIVTAGNDGGGAVAASALTNTASGAGLSLRRHDNTSAQNIWVQWWAVPGGVASDAHCYRATWGYQFNNFSYATIPWALYKDFFGASAVENADGTHKPSAQSWYDSTYKGVGGSGNCYGMSVSSRRLFFNALTTFHHNWFASNAQPYAWLYPWQTETRETAQEDQGGQLSAEMAATINDYYSNQSTSTACSRISTLLSSRTDRPAICFRGSNWGHAVVPYKMTSSGNTRTVYYWDNNRTYATSETCGDDPDSGTADVSTGAVSFKTGSYTGTRKMICLSYSECVRTPHLPASAQGSTSGVQVAVLAGGASLSQVEDASGQRLLGPDGEMLPDRTRRLPDAMKFTPITGTTPLKNYPGMFFFGPKAGDLLELTCAGTGTGKSLLLYSPGQVLRLDYQGSGQVQRRAGGDYPYPGLWIHEAKSFRPREIEFILTAGDEEILTLRNLVVSCQGLFVKVRRLATPGNPLALGISAVDRPRGMAEDRDTAAVSADLVISTYARGGRRPVIFRGLKLPPDTQAQIVPTYENGRPTSVEVTVNRGTLLKPPWRILAGR